MNPSDLNRRAKEVFMAALEKESPEQQIQYVDLVCADDPELRRLVLELLSSLKQANSFLENKPGAALNQTEMHPDGSMRVGEIIDNFKLLEEIGEGGMGTVWMAQQTEPVKRVVALKLIKAGMDSKQVIARFEAERQALALMDHPNIAKVLDGGATSAGRPYFVMDLVKGVPITQYCDANHLTPRQRLELFVPVCLAVQHAHQKGIIHRDLKPSNVLVALYDGKPVPKVIDFGVAKAAGQMLTERTLVTGFGTIVGTLEYMSPEQAEFNQLDIDTRSDIYSLGVLLYELLAGSPPFSRRDLEKAGLLELLRVIREQEPSKPSTKLSSAETLPTLAANRGTEPARLTKLVRGELDWIVMKALEKHRNRRYETANGFAMDLQRYLVDEPVQACPPSVAYRLHKFARRHRATVIASALILFVLVAGIAGTTFGLIRAEFRRSEADKARAAEAFQRQIADAERSKAEQAEADTLADFRASTDDAIEQLIGSKPDLGPQERTYLENTLNRWQSFAARKGDDQRSRAIRAEGHRRVAVLWHKLGRQDEARKGYEIARDLYQTLVGAFPSAPEYQLDLAKTHSGLGALLGELNLRDMASVEFESARDLQSKLSDAFPDVPQYALELARTHYSLGNLRLALGQRDAARSEYETARDLYRDLVRANPTVPQYQQLLSVTHHNLGNLLRELSQPDAARAEFETARQLQINLANAFPAVPVYKQDLARTYNSLGILLGSLGQRAAARPEFEAARELQKNLADSFPAVPVYQQDLASTHNNLGMLLTNVGELDAARVEYERACDLQKKLVFAFPAVPRYQQELARAHNNLGNLLALAGDRNAARTELETGRDLRKKTADAFPAVPRYQIELGDSYCEFARLIRDDGQVNESLLWFDLAIQTLTPVYAQDSRQITARQLLRASHHGRAVAYDQLNRHDEAILDWDNAIELDSGVEQPFLRSGRAVSRLKAGQSTEVVAEIDEFLKNATITKGEDWCSFASVYALASGKWDDPEQVYAARAMELLRQGVIAGFNDAAKLAKDSDLEPLRKREDFQLLLAELQAPEK